MSNDSVTTIATSDGSQFRVGRTSAQYDQLGPVQLHLMTGQTHQAVFFECLEIGEACALIAALQLVVDDVEREGQEQFDRHVEGKTPKFIEMPVSTGVSDAH